MHRWHPCSPPLITHVEQQQTSQSTDQPGRPAARTGQDLFSSLHALLPPRRSLPCCGRHLETSPAAAAANRAASSLTSSAQLSPAPDQPVNPSASQPARKPARV
ncbi:hypothetical protein CCHR01_07212 [Colletotrichum chrysophilum]|uniref:Uncharacterized protein n=1 Tax=Colletotrichum chrysophilum TaxID=1836956 RepID=A0AAD9AL51_9PEZI|nr:hypothetical protein CCHR01_07212 [Colletotrichum chrysophilum]